MEEYKINGQRYNNRMKTFCVDGYEKHTQIIHRKDMCDKYITELDPRSHRWVQIKEN